jgi:integrase/recombinase XerD
MLQIQHDPRHSGVDAVIKGTWVVRRMAAEHLGIILARFVEDLRVRGYTRAVIQRYAQVVEHFALWLKHSTHALANASELHVRRFIRYHLPRCHCPKPASKNRVTCRTALGRFLEYLRSGQRIKDPPSVDRFRPTDPVVDAYDNYLGRVLGLSSSTRQRRWRDARAFLEWRFGSGCSEPHRIKAKDVSRFVSNRTRALNSGGARHVTTSLRCFLRYLEFTGQLRSKLSDLVLQSARTPSDQPPKVLDEAQWRKFINSFSRNSSIGQRDYAIALCLSALALRADEVAGLTLEDLDWKAMAVRLRKTKQRRERLLPLPDEVARALTVYLKQGRPRTTTRALFVRHRAPLGEPLRGRFIRRIIRRAFLRCGLRLTGTHVLRHTWATWAHRRGASLKVIADVLGHRSLDTTRRYAHINLEELRQASLPWPGRKQ